MTDPGTLGGEFSYAKEINERGQVVGWSHTENYYSHASLWDSTSEPTSPPNYAVVTNPPKTTQVAFAFGFLSVSLLLDADQDLGLPSGIKNLRET